MHYTPGNIAASVSSESPTGRFPWEFEAGRRRFPLMADSYMIYRLLDTQLYIAEKRGDKLDPVPLERKHMAMSE